MRFIRLMFDRTRYILRYLRLSFAKFHVASRLITIPQYDNG